MTSRYSFHGRTVWKGNKQIAEATSAAMAQRMAKALMALWHVERQQRLMKKLTTEALDTVPADFMKGIGK